jgi:hypothetical protein
MVKRVGSSVLWFVSIGWGMNLLAVFAGLPELPGLVGAAALATFVGVDPLHLFWAPLVIADRRNMQERVTTATVVQTRI